MKRTMTGLGVLISGSAFAWTPPEAVCSLTNIVSQAAPPVAQILGFLLLFGFFFFGYREARQGQYALALGLVALGIVFLSLAWFFAEPIGSAFGKLGSAIGC